MPFFSVVIPTRNAAGTMPSTIVSLERQTFTDWEAIVVDDGSRDDTVRIVQEHAAHDARIRVVRASSPGVSAARNEAIALAEGSWLLFLDADDTLFAAAMSAWHAGIEADSGADVVCGAWVRVAADGRVVAREHWPVTPDMFPVFARLSAFPIHSAVVRRSTVFAARGFDATYVTCEDWDLWQRMARAGARFVSISEDVARYHMRPRSASLAARQMLSDGLRVITTGHGPDPRVEAPVPLYANGMPKADLGTVAFGYACWPAGLLLGNGEDAVALLDLLNDEGAPDLDPSIAADAVFRSATLPRCAGPDGWGVLWPEISPAVNRFLNALEARTRAPRLSRRVKTALARSVLQAVPPGTVTRIAHSLLHTIDIGRPVQSLHAPPDIERVVIRVHAGSDVIGAVELPVCDGRVDADVMRDAIARDYGWQILGRFFDMTVYEQVVRRTTADGSKAVRRNVVLAPACRNDEEWNVRRHDVVGWTVFLQELWGHADWPVGAFYDSNRHVPEATTRTSNGRWLTVDVLDPPVDWRTDATEAIKVELTIAGAPVCSVEIPAEAGGIRNSRLRAILTTTAGVELLHVAVREALIGRSWYRGTLREHLSQRRSTSAPAPTSAPSTVAGIAPSSAAHVAAMVRADPARAIIGARRYGWPACAVSRRADLPSAARRDVFAAARMATEPVVDVAPWRRTRRIAYVPDVLWAGALQPLARPALTDLKSPRNPENPENPLKSAFGRHHFESLFARAADPWRYTSAYEARKYEQTLSLLPSEPIGRALEIGCAEGHFTDALAPRVGALVATDISSIALARATLRCARHQNVSFARLDLARDELPGVNDLIVCSEVLYYVGTVDDLAHVGRKLRDALAEGGRLLTAHANVASDDGNAVGFVWDVPFGARTIGETLRAIPGLHLAREIRTALYSVMEFQRSDRPRTPLVIEADFAMPERDVAERIQWSGGASAAAPPPAGSRLPILMYHRLSDPSRSEAMRYTVSPDQLRSHFEYLRDAGFHSVSLAEWTAAIHTRRPLPGRPVALTFDDGYVDFIEYAWPLLQHYGFGATLFVVSGHVGGWNAWDAGASKPVRLMDWAAIQRVSASGIEIGAHSVTHAPMTGLTPAEIVREASRARADIQRRIDQPLSAFAYPYGDSDPCVEHLVAASGFLTGVTCRFGSSVHDDRPMRLPRIEISGTDTLSDFIRKLSV